MNILRAATEEEVEKIRATSDLTPTSFVIALDTQKGPILGVLRLAQELDPVYFPDNCDNKLKLIFLRDIYNFLLGQGQTSFYFNVHNTDELANWRETVLHQGAEQVSPVPVIRYKRNLR